MRGRVDAARQPADHTEARLREFGAEFFRHGLPIKRCTTAANNSDAGMLKRMASLAIEPDGRIVNFDAEVPDTLHPGQ